jgi:CIC family chloride channel protein
MAVASLVGLAAGLGAVGFAELIRAVHWFFVDLIVGDWLSALPDWRVLIAPALGAILVGPITRIFAPETRGHGVPEVMLAVETRGGRIRPRVATATSVAAALTIGSGGSVGREGPIVQIGSAFGSTVGQWLRLSEENVKLLVAAGAAGGIAATFNAPIAGVFFSLEVILRRFNTRNFSVVVLASVIATATAVALRGDAPAIAIPGYRLEHAVEIPFYAVLGGVAALGGVAFIHVLYWTEDRFNGLSCRSSAA